MVKLLEFLLFSISPQYLKEDYTIKLVIRLDEFGEWETLAILAEILTLKNYTLEWNSVTNIATYKLTLKYGMVNAYDYLD